MEGLGLWCVRYNTLGGRKPPLWQFQETGLGGYVHICTRVCAGLRVCTHIHSPNIHRWRVGLSYVQGRIQVDGVSGAQEYWDLGAFSGQGGLLAWRQIWMTLWKEGPSCLQPSRESPRSLLCPSASIFDGGHPVPPPSRLSCQLLPFEAPWTSPQLSISQFTSPSTENPSNSFSLLLAYEVPVRCGPAGSQPPILLQATLASSYLSSWKSDPWLGLGPLSTTPSLHHICWWQVYFPPKIRNKTQVLAHHFCSIPTGSSSQSH